MMKNYKYIIILLLLLVHSGLKAQDPSFTQCYNNPLYLNPAFAGNSDGIRVCLQYRDLWDRIPGIFTANSASFDVREPCLNAAWGIGLLQAVEGEGFLKTTSINGTYAYGIKLNGQSQRKSPIRFFKNPLYLAMGITAKVASVGIDWSKLEFYDQLDPIYGKMNKPSSAQIPDNVNRYYADFNTGILLEGKMFNKKVRDYAAWNLGFSVSNLFEDYRTIYDYTDILPRRYTLHYGIMLPFSGSGIVKDGYVYPHLMFQKQRDLYQYLIGATAIREPIILGLTYHVGQNPTIFKNTNAVCALVGYQKPFRNTNTSWQITYSYDLNFLGLGLSTFGSHEIGFKLFFDGASILCSGTNSNADDRESPCLKVKRKGLLPPF